MPFGAGARWGEDQLKIPAAVWAKDRCCFLTSVHACDSSLESFPSSPPPPLRPVRPHTHRPRALVNKRCAQCRTADSLIEITCGEKWVGCTPTTSTRSASGCTNPVSRLLEQPCQENWGMVSIYPSLPPSEPIHHLPLPFPCRAHAASRSRGRLPRRQSHSRQGLTVTVASAEIHDGVPGGLARRRHGNSPVSNDRGGHQVLAAGRWASPHPLPALPAPGKVSMRAVHADRV